MTTRLRLAASLVAGIMAAVSVAFMLRAAHRNPSVLLLVLMAIWVAAPFVALFGAVRSSQRKSIGVLTLVIAAGTLAAYAIDALGPPHAKAATVFVATPVVSWVVGGIALVVIRLRG